MFLSSIWCPLWNLYFIQTMEFAIDNYKSMIQDRKSSLYDLQQQMIQKQHIFLLLIAIGISCLPSTFDIRYQPSNAIYANFQSSPDSICESYQWGRQLAQVFSNKVSADLKQKIVLSTQQIAECIPGENDKCKQSTLKNIQDAIKYIQTQGLNQQYCYNNKFFQLPSKYCARKCTDGQPFIRKFKAIVNKQTSYEKFLQSLGNGQVFGFAIVKYFEQMNYYSPDKPENMKDGGEFFSYGIAEIVGWRQQGQELNLRMGAPGWGYKGYGWVKRNSPILVEFYSLKNLGQPQVSVL